MHDKLIMLPETCCIYDTYPPEPYTEMLAQIELKRFEMKTKQNEKK